MTKSPGEILELFKGGYLTIAEATEALEPAFLGAAQDTPQRDCPSAEELADSCFSMAHPSEGASYPSVLAAIERALSIAAAKRPVDSGDLRTSLHHLMTTNIPGCLDGSWEGAMLRPEKVSKLIDAVMALCDPAYAPTPPLLTLADIEHTILIEFNHSEDRAGVRRAAERVWTFLEARAKTLARRTATSVLPRREGQAAECDGGLHSGDPAYASWQPIETFPKDEETFLATDDRVAGGFLQAVYWNPDTGRLHVADAQFSYAWKFFTHWCRISPVSSTNCQPSLLKEATRAQHCDIPEGEPARFVRNGVLETCQCRRCSVLSSPTRGTP